MAESRVDVEKMIGWWIKLSVVVFSLSFNSVLYSQTLDTNLWDGQIYIKIKNSEPFINLEYPNGGGLPIEISNIINTYSITSIEQPFAVANDFTLNRIFKVKFQNPTDITKIIRAFSNVSYIEYAEPIPIDKIFCTTENPTYWSTSAQVYHHNLIQSCNGWSIINYSYTPAGSVPLSNVKVAVIDNECDVTHPDLAGSVLTTTDVANGGTIVAVNSSTWNHGTHVTGIIAATMNNNLGLAGIAYGVHVMFIKAANTFGSSTAITNGYDGIVWAVLNGAKVINCSWGGFIYSNTNALVVQWAISTNNVIIVAAAGNNYTNAPTYPAAFPGVYAVAATDNMDNKAAFSNYGNWVDIAAPGVSIYSTINQAVNPSNPYDYLSGTSMAAPEVTALCGLICALNPTYTPAMVLNCISSTADPTTGFTPALGRINVWKALQCATGTGNNVQFSTNTNMICSGGTVQFTDQSITTSPIIAWQWSFASPSFTLTSNVQNPSITFAAAGVYSCVLTVTTTIGQVFSSYVPQYVFVVGVNNPVFSYSPPYCKGDEVQITFDANGWNSLLINYSVNGGATTTFTPNFIFSNLYDFLVLSPTNTNNLSVVVGPVSVFNYSTNTLFTCPVTYTLNGALVDCCSNLIPNGDFEQCNFAGFTSSLTLCSSGSSPGYGTIKNYTSAFPIPPHGNCYLLTDGPVDFPGSFPGCLPPATVPSIGIIPNYGFILYQSSAQLYVGSSYIFSFYLGDVNYLFSTLPSKFRVKVINPANTVIYSNIYIPNSTSDIKWWKYEVQIPASSVTISGSYTFQIEQWENFLVNAFDYVWDDIFVRAINNNTLSISATPSATCISSTVSLTANYLSPAPPPYSYSWTASVGGSYPNSSVITATASSPSNNYTVSVVDANLCINTATISVPAYNCCTNCNVTFTGGTISTSPPTNSVYCINGNLIISGSVTIQDCELKISPNVSIVVTPNSTLNILGSHLYSCSDMWSGIVVQNDGVLNISSGKMHASSLIEDAVIGVEVSGNGTLTSSTYFSSRNTTFNRNYVDVYIHDYQRNIASYPFFLTGNVFTCRDIPFTPNSLMWPSTAMVSASVIPSTPLATPYIDNAVYSPTSAAAYLKAPYSGQKSFIGIRLKNVGYTSGSFVPGGLTYRELVIGAGGNSQNILDNKVYGIWAFNANFSSYNNVYQNMVQIGKGGSSGSVGIYAVADHGLMGNLNVNRVRVVPTNTMTGVGNNKFFDCSTGMQIENYSEMYLMHNDIRSQQVNTAPVTVVNHTGQNGIVCKTGKYVWAEISHNKVYNIENGISFIATVVSSTNASVPSQQRNGQLNINDNVIQPHLTGFPITSQYVSNGIYAASVLLAPPQYSVIGTTSVTITGNKISKVWRGIYTGNWYKKDVRVQSNCITMVNDSYGFVQYGIESANNMPMSAMGVIMYNNNVTGVTGASGKMKGIWVVQSTQNAVRCNTVGLVSNGIEFSGTSAPCHFLGNTMQNCASGFVLSNNAIIGQQGSSGNPSDNKWVGNSIDTYCDNSFAILSNLYIRWSGFYIPSNNQASPGFLPYQFPISLLQTSGPFITCSSIGPCSSIIPPPTPIVLPLPPPFNTIDIPVLEKIAQNQVPAFIDTASSRFIGQNHLFRTLLATPTLTSSSSVLQQFVQQNQTILSSKEIFHQTESDISQGNYGAANSKLAVITPQNTAEQNHKTFYQIYLNYLQNG